MLAPSDRHRSTQPLGGGGYEEYHPYGSTAWWAGDSSTVSQKRYRYTGMERDEETGLQCHGVRYYAPRLGRWASADPIGLGDGVNRFAYCGGNPAASLDRSGPEDIPKPGAPGAGVDPDEFSALDANPDYVWGGLHVGGTHGGPLSSTVGMMGSEGDLPSASRARTNSSGNTESVDALTIPANFRLPLHAQVRLNGSWQQVKLGEDSFHRVAEAVPEPSADICLVVQLNFSETLGYRNVRNMSDNLFGDGSTRPPGHGPYDKPTPLSPATRERNLAMLTQLDDQLYRGKMAILGVSLAPGDLGNADNATDHWVTIQGRGYDEDGAVHYWGSDAKARVPFRAPERAAVKFYVDPDTLTLFSLGSSANTEFGGRYRVYGTNVKTLEARR